MAVKATNQVDIVDLTDGYSVILSSDSVTVPGDLNGAAIAESNAFSVSVTAMCGSDKVPCTVVVTCPSGISAGTQTTSNNVVTVPFSVTSQLVGSAMVTLAVTITDAGVTVGKSLGVAVAKTGASGQSSYTHIRYSENANGSSMTSTPTSDTKYIGVYVGTASTCPAYNDPGFMWSKYMGEDAFLVEVTSSAGFIFKNTQAATTLTANVFKGGVPQSASDLTALGLAVKWYRDGSSTAAGTGLTLQIGAGDVTNRATYVVKLEDA